jgi:hypothetical protein
MICLVTVRPRCAAVIALKKTTPASGGNAEAVVVLECRGRRHGWITCHRGRRSPRS